MLSDRCLSCLSVALVYCGQTVGTEIGLGQATLCYMGTQSQGTAAPHFSARVYCGQTVAHLGNC